MLTNEFKILFSFTRLSRGAAEAYRNIRLIFGKDFIDDSVSKCAYRVKIKTVEIRILYDT